MKSILKTSAFIAMSAIMATSITSCDDNNGENTGDLSAKEQTLNDTYLQEYGRCGYQTDECLQ